MCSTSIRCRISVGLKKFATAAKSTVVASCAVVCVRRHQAKEMEKMVQTTSKARINLFFSFTPKGRGLSRLLLLKRFHKPLIFLAQITPFFRLHSIMACGLLLLSGPTLVLLVELFRTPPGQMALRACYPSCLLKQQLVESYSKKKLYSLHLGVLC